MLENDDDIIVDLNTNELNCIQLSDPEINNRRKTKWDQIVKQNGGTHPSVGDADTRLLNRMRSSAVSAVFGAGTHPDRKLWISDPRSPSVSDFVPTNKYK